MSKPQPAQACVCIGCGASFKQYVHKIEAGGGKYCTQKCRNANWGYQNVIKAALPGMVAELVKRTNLSDITVRKNLSYLLSRNEAHGARMVSTGVPATRAIRAYEVEFALGASEDADHPKTVREVRQYLIKAAVLKAMPATQATICKRTDMSPSSLSILIRQMHKDQLCHISGWRRAAHGAPVPVFKAGKGVDAKCKIVNLTQTERTARFMAKVEKNGKTEALRTYWRDKARARAVLKRGDPYINALFGAPADRKAA